MYHIIDDSSSVAYEEYCQTRKRERSPEEDSESESSGVTFNYETAKPKAPPQPDYICYANNSGWGMPHLTTAPAHTAYPMALPTPGYQQYYCYPNGMPVQNAGAGAKIACASPKTTATAPQPKPEGKTKQVWLGRTKAQVADDNLKMAVRENVYKYDPMKPHGAAADQLFWVVEVDGSTVLYNFKTIDEALGPGKWERDPRFGNAIFIREVVKKEQ
ncbi:hypothetical protein K461DRAFT_268062 [Myriangium duriaei CBS 260.36]|uniref:Uncharacterized protein n=1 Tax=Myriangium duriaei CBS 260.36 TaxID=1168546 RepID=A0A9P4J3N9_9PEZI|nr:hypothetical protein K461DRAFT_268062 [Myriangium duriaei CBS 260.36]